MELDEEVTNNKKGSVVLQLIKPKQVKSLTFDLIDQFYRIAGPTNMKLEVLDGEIKIKMKPILLPFYKTEHRDELDLLKHSLVEGKMIYRPNSVVLDSDLVSCGLWINTIKKSGKGVCGNRRVDTRRNYHTKFERSHSEAKKKIIDLKLFVVHFKEVRGSFKKSYSNC